MNMTSKESSPVTPEASSESLRGGTGFTPGPWSWDSRNGRWYLTSCAGDTPHVIVLGWPGGLDPSAFGPDGDMHGCADAALIESAPEMYEALKAAHVFIRNGIGLGYIRMPDADVPDPAHLVPDQIRAALAKAEGR